MLRGLPLGCSDGEAVNHLPTGHQQSPALGEDLQQTLCPCCEGGRVVFGTASNLSGVV